MTANMLRRDAVGFWELTYQSISQVSPAGAMAVTLTSAAAYAYGALPLTYLISIVAAAFLINTTYQFSKEIASAGGFYGYVSHGAGVRSGIVAGILFVLSYAMVFANANLFVAGVFVPGILAQLLGIHSPGWVWVPITVAIYLIIIGLATSGIRPSLRYSLWTGVVEIAVLVAISIAIIVHTGPGNTGRVFDDPALAKHGLSGLGIGVIFAMFSMSGSSAAITLGEETKAPRRDVRRAVVTSFAISSALFLLMSYALTVGWGPGRMAGFSSASIPGVLLANRALDSAAGWVLVAFIINSLVAGSLAPLNSAARMIFAFARDNVLVPRRVAGVNRNGTPVTSILLIGGFGLVSSLLAGWGLGPFDGFLVLVTISSVALFVGHILANVALPAYYRRRGELRGFAHVVAPLVATVLVGFGLWYTIYPFPYPVVIGPIVVGAAVVAGLVLVRLLGSDTLRRAGRVNVPDDQQAVGARSTRPPGRR